MGGGRPTLLIIIGGVVLLYIGLGFWANVYVEALWFGQLGFRAVFLTTILAKLGVGAAFGVTALIIVGSNLALARHFSSQLTELHLFDEGLTELERLLSGSRLIDLLAFGAALVVSGILGLIGLSEWDQVLRYLNREPFNAVDPIFGRDIGFFVFSLPFWSFVRFWLLLAVVASMITVSLFYLYRGAVVIEERGFHLRPYARRHLCLLAAGLFLLIAWGYRLSMFRLLYSESGFTFGASYTDLYARMNAYWILLVVAVVCAVLFIVSLYSRRQNLPIFAVVTMVVAAVVVSGLYPMFVQQFIVKPNEFEKEMPYIKNSIEYTRKAYGLDRVQEVPFPFEQRLTADDLQANTTTIQNIKLLDKNPLRRTYQQIQEIRTYYDFSNIDEDRYVIDGQYRQVMLAARELSYDQIPSKTWQNEHLFYTHGYGVCLSPVNTATPEGMPVLFVKDIPPAATTEDLTITRPELYYGEKMENYVVVRTRQQEFDYPKGEENQFCTYQGVGGVQIRSFIRRVAFAKYFSELNFLISPLITLDSQVMFHRRVQDRVMTIAPFLQYDHDPYLVIAQGKLFWIQDAYTVTSSYPYSERFSGLLPVQDQDEPGEPAAIPGPNQPPRRRLVRAQPSLRDINYIRNSVKIVIDAYTGATQFYVADTTDPLIRTYQRIFPTLFTPLDQMPQSLRAHLRYPRDLFAIQAAMFRTYHMQNPQVFYNQEDLWAIPNQVYAGNQQQVVPYYAVMKTPEIDRAELLLLLPFTPSNKDNMIGWMAAQCDPANYGRIIVYNFPKQELVYGPMQIEARITQDADISKELTLWNQEGSEVIRGDLIVVPIKQSLLYVEPMYLRSSKAGLPELKRVIVAHGGRIAMRERLDQALAAVFSFSIPEPGQGPARSPAIAAEAATTGTTPLADLASQALTQFNQAEQRLRAGDWGGYGTALQQLEESLKKLAEAAGTRKAEGDQTGKP
ncbi:MAG: UPF0182 family protein [Candidatus Latescibacteria bacterium]|nr:UPF0182 family protein [Candidatus Latescibacterota bacterium]